MVATTQASRPTEKSSKQPTNEATTSKHFNQQIKSSNQKERWG
jgi:hypothetical protein